MLDDEPTKLSERIEAAYKAIHHRLMHQDEYITPAERDKMYDALGALAVRRKENAA